MNSVEIPEALTGMNYPAPGAGTEVETTKVQMSDGGTAVITIKLTDMGMSIDDQLTVLHEESIAQRVERPPPVQLPKFKIIDAGRYQPIAKYVRDFRGLGIECEIEMLKMPQFQRVEELTLKAIIRAELKKRDSEEYPRCRGNPMKLLKTYEKRAKDRSSDVNLVKLAVQMAMGPVMLARLVLIAKYQVDEKRVEELIATTRLIMDDKLAANVKKCIASDISAGPLANMRHHSLNEKFRQELRKRADKLDLYYYDEGDSRMADVQMIIPFIFKDQLIFWIMSCSVFGDPVEHTEMLNRVTTYRERFGAGIIIYWVGYHEDILDMPENLEGILIMDEFPKEEDIETLI